MVTIRIPGIDLYDRARPEFECAPENAGHREITQVRDRLESVLQDFYRSSWHRKIAANPSFQEARLESQGLT